MKTHSVPYKILKSRLSRLMLVMAIALVDGVLLPFSTAQASESDSPNCVTDMSGRPVCLSTRSPRIISLSPGSTELLFAAGAGDRVIAVDQHSDYPTNVFRLPRVGGYPNINVEAIVGMSPDLVVIWKGGDSPTVIQQLESLGVNTFHVNAVNFAGIEQALLGLGTIAGTTEQARKTVAAFQQRLAGLRRQYSEQRPLSVFFEIWRTPLMTVGNGLAINDVITLCGGRNIYGELAERTPRVGIESLISRNPQVIIGSNPKGDTPETRKALLDYWSQWQNLQAVERHQLFSVPSDLIARPTPRILDGAEMICRQLQAVRSATKHSGYVVSQKNPMMRAHSEPVLRKQAPANYQDHPLR
ncbi:cobalamin-binding protein [Endozoicomonas sp. SCSIO W0465]|uniref:cobalamin-binding protein n=1 Tax=Endozoicomonas sp. SCSIO W0465 TaxID=2918516 RepID=UPI002074FC5B|nr:cobalamin-binding protein [Endozoicomonas sp. SCSIO W0465]USE35377.1 cobalamin-binding protein [Endozoicomonas sp. SCSIO W0465]